MKKVKVKNKSHYLVLICCLVLVLGIVIYFIINLIGSRELSNNNDINDNITLNKKDIISMIMLRFLKEKIQIIIYIFQIFYGEL